MVYSMYINQRPIGITIYHTKVVFRSIMELILQLLKQKTLSGFYPGILFLKTGYGGALSQTFFNLLL